MGSWIRCKCDHLVHKNLFCGTGIALIATEDFLDLERPRGSVDDLISDLISSSDLLLECKNCGRLIVVRENSEVFDVHFYSPDSV